MGLTEKKYVNYFHSDAEREKYILDCIDKMIALFPDYDNFHTSEYTRILYPNIPERRKINSIICNIVKVLFAEKMIESSTVINTKYHMTEKGRKVKNHGGYYKHLENMKKEDLKATVNSITNNIYGNSESLNNAIGSNISISSTNRNTLNENQKEELKNIGVHSEEIEELNNIVSANTKDSSQRSKKLIAWLSSVTASMVSRGVYDHITQITQFINQLV